MSKWITFIEDNPKTHPKDAIPIKVKDCETVDRQFGIVIAPYPEKFEECMYIENGSTKKVVVLSLGRNKLGPPYNFRKFEWRELTKNEMMAYL